MKKRVAGRAEPSKGEDQNMTENLTEREEPSGDEPYVGMEFDTEDDAKTFYDAYARRVGFSTHIGQYNRAKPDGPIISWDFSCSREVFKRKNVGSCNAMLKIERKGSDGWVVTKFEDEHNHSTMTPSKIHCLRPRRHFTGSTNTAAETDEAPSDVYVSIDGNHVTFEPNEGTRQASPTEPSRSLRKIVSVNYMKPCGRKTILGKDAQNLMNYFKKMQSENPGFFYAIQLDDDSRLTNVFWVDARSRTAYNYFGDAVTFDTMYRPNQFQVPFAPFTGVNHHGEQVLFGCALLLDESESSFIWLFQTWLEAMNNRPPVSITTDQDRAIQVAASKVFPETRHCICKWHILREGQERLAPIYLAHPSFHGELYNCVNFSETIEDFESSWASLLDKYKLRKNEWLQAVYKARMQWAPVYFRGTFFAAISSNKHVSSFFDGYVDQHTSLPMFFKQYEKSLENSLKRELEADYDTMCSTPVLRTPSPMEQQAANLYTKKVFSKFQEELVETFVYTANKIEGDMVVNKFRVAKYEHDHQAYIVTLDFSDMKATCSCQMFEYSGLLCRHILTVFTVTNVLTLPSHYILNRWTRNARTGAGLDEPDSEGMESLSSRFNSLCREAIKYAEEGAVAVETYNAAFNVLREGAKKFAALKKSVSKVTAPASRGSGNIQEDVNKKNLMLSVPELDSSVWPWEEMMPSGINLNDAGAHVADLNHPSMVPLSVNHDGVLTDNTAIRTCFKDMNHKIENKTSKSADKVAVIYLKLQDYGKSPPEDKDVQFRLTKLSLEPMFRSMTHIGQHLSAPANKVAVINLKLQDTKTSSGETEVKFQVSKDTLGYMLQQMTYIREQL